MSRERKYLKSKSATNLNIVLKIAKKRAFVDAILPATLASKFFTQYLEDIAQPFKSDNRDEMSSQSTQDELKYWAGEDEKNRNLPFYFPFDCKHSYVYDCVHDYVHDYVHNWKLLERKCTAMNFYSIKDLRVETKSICEHVRQQGEAVITNNGKPALLLLDVADNDFDELLRAVRQAKAMIAFNSMRATAARNGYLTESAIETEIVASRAKRRAML